MTMRARLRMVWRRGAAGAGATRHKACLPNSVFRKEQTIMFVRNFVRAACVVVAALLLASASHAQKVTPEGLLAQMKANPDAIYLDVLADREGHKKVYFYLPKSFKQRPDGVVMANVLGVNDRVEVGGENSRRYVAVLTTYSLHCANWEYKAPAHTIITETGAKEPMEDDTKRAFENFYGSLNRDDGIARRIAKIVCQNQPTAAPAAATTPAAASPAEQRLNAALAPSAPAAKVAAVPPAAREAYFREVTNTVAAGSDNSRCEVKLFHNRDYAARLVQWYDLSDDAAIKALRLTETLCAMVFAPAKDAEGYKQELREEAASRTGSQRDVAGQRAYLADALPALEAAKAEVERQKQAKREQQQAAQRERDAKAAEHERQLRAGTIPVESIADATIVRDAVSAVSIIMLPPVAGGGTRMYGQMGLLAAAQGNVLLGAIGPRGYAVLIDANTKFIGARESVRVGGPFGFVGRYLGTKVTEAGNVATFAADYVGPR